MKTIGIIQARMGSTRLPQKVVKHICGVSVIEHIVNRVVRTHNIDETIIATSVESEDMPLADLVKARGYNLFRGSRDNVLERFYLCAKDSEADIVVRFTGDNLLIDPRINAKAVEEFKKSSCDYLHYGNNLPLGTHVEVFSFEALQKSYFEAKDQICLEHVTPYMYKNSRFFIIKAINHGESDYTDLRWTLDTLEDYELICKIYEYFFYEKHNKAFDFSIDQILDAYKIHPEWRLINNKTQQIRV